MINSSSKTFSKVTAKIVMALLAVCLVLAVAPQISVLSPVAPVASAAEYTVNSGSASEINSQLASYASSDRGCTVNVTLTSDLDITDTSKDIYTSGISGIVIPAGITVNFYMNAHSIISDRQSGAAWQLPYLYAIENHGTLHVYAGTKTTPNPSSSNATISLTNHRLNMHSGTRYEYAYATLVGIYNDATLTVGKNVSISIKNYLGYEGDDAEMSGSTSLFSEGIYNTDSANCTVNTISINIDAYSYAHNGNYQVFTTPVSAACRVYSYGIIGGTITVNGNTNIAVKNFGAVCEDSDAADYGRGYIACVGYDIASSRQISVNGGEYSYDSTLAQDHDGMKSGNGYCYEGGIAYTSVVPMLSDGTFSVATTNANHYNESSSTFTLLESTMTRFSTFPFDHITYAEKGYNTYGGVLKSSTDNYKPTWPTGTIVAGQFKDEAGNVYSVDSSASDGTHPAAVVDGAVDGTYRVHIIYRYWQESAKNNIDTSITGTTGLIGYSYVPLMDGTDIVSSKATFSGLTSSTQYSKAGTSAVSYASGGSVFNSNYWTFYNIAYATPSGEFSDINFTSSANRGTVFYTVANKSGSSVFQDVTAPCFVFVDYYRVSATTITCSTTTTTATYTGSPILPSDLGLAIKSANGNKTYTGDYDIDNNNPSKIDVDYTYSGTNAAGEAESGTGLPTNAGTYSVNVKIADQSAYNKDPNLYKNRKALDYTFTLTVNPAKAQRGSLPQSISLTYGTKLNEKLAFATYSAQGINGEGAQNGVFTFTNASDGTGYKNVGSSSVQITWTPAASVTNYEQTVFSVDYTVAKALLTIAPNAATVMYGETAFDTPFSATFDGLCGNDNTAAVQQTITDSLSFMINKGGAWVAYTPDQVGAGTYSIRATFEGNLPSVMNNYEYTYVFGSDDNPYGNLTVNKRALTVKATAVSREYAASSYAVNVTFTIESGRYGVDDINVSTTTGSVANNNVGTRTVNGIDKAKANANLSGGAAANYTVNEVVYATGSTLTVEITKATPVVGTPTTDERYYRHDTKLSDVTINSVDSSVDGNWQWVDATINPTVNVKYYQAKFVPNDSTNYNEKIVDVALNIKATPVVISYEKTISYGDKKPNITDFTYTSAQDPSFNFESVDCEGNISVSTTYEQGSPVSATGYPVTITATNYVDKDGNYTFTIRNGVIYVTKRTVTFTVQNVAITYGSNFVLNNSTVSVLPDENDLYGTDTVNDVTANGEAPTFTFTSDYSAQTNYGAGTYYISAHNNFTTSANYDVEFVDGTLTVNKADLTISAKPMTVEYNTAISDATLASAYTISGAKKNETLAQMMTEGTIGVDTTYYQGAVVNAEGYPITIDVSECRFPNYNVVVNNSTITVIKATPVIGELPTATLVHNQTLSQAVFTGGSVEGDIPGKFVYNSDVAVVYSSDPYNYPATFIPDDTANYNTVSIPALTLYVSKLPVTGELAISGIPMKGETLTVDVSGLNPDEIGVYTFSWKVGDVEIATGTSYTLDETYINQSITVYATANGYYEGTKSATTSKITPKLTSIETILDAGVWANYFTKGGLDTYKGTTTVPYDGAEHIATFALANSALSSTSVGTIIVKYNGSTTAPKNAGYYTVSIDVGTPSYTTITERDGKTYDAASGKYVYSSISGYEIGTLYISPKDYTVTLTFNDKVYDGTRVATASYEESGACTLAGGTKDDVQYNAAAASYAFTDANAGTNKTVNVTGAALTGTAAENYNLTVVKAAAGKATITPRTLRASVEPVSREYEKDNYTVYLAFEEDASSLAPTDTTAQVYVDDSGAYGVIDNYTAGTRFVTVYDAELAGSKAANYVLELTNEVNLTVEITKATPSYPIPSAGVVYYNSARALNEISLGYDNWQWDDSIRNTVPTAGTHTYKAVFTPNDTQNEATVEYDVTLVVNKAPVTIRIASFNNVVYGDNVPTYYYTATGLTGTDTIKKNVDGYILLDSNYTAGSPVGTYAIVRSGEFESDNYSFTYVPGSITVNKRTAYTTAEAVARAYEKGNTNVDVNFSALSNVYAGDASSVYLATSSVTGTIASDTAGTKKVNYTTPALAGEKADNYTLYVSNSNLTVEIEKAKISDIVFPASGTVTYGQRLSYTVFDEPYDAKGLGSFSMENPTTTPSAVGTFATGYNVVFTPTDSANYATETKAIRLTVETAVLSGVAVQVSGTTQVGKTLYATVGNVPASAAPYVTYQWYRVDSADASYHEGYMFASGTDSVTLTVSEQGKYIICVATATDGAPYVFNGEARTDESIQAETLSFWQRLIKWLYKLMSGFTQLFGKISG